MHERYHKFLGGLYTFENTTKSKACVIYDVFKDGLTNIDDLLIRNELKVKIYSEYFLGSKRFLFSIHDLTTSQIDQIESLTHSYIKKWLGIPRGGSWCLVHDRHGLNIKSISHFYKECRTVSLINVRKFSDARVRHALDTKEQRESSWTRKFSSAVLAHNIENAISNPNPSTPTSTHTSSAPPSPLASPHPQLACEPSPLSSSLPKPPSPQPEVPEYWGPLLGMQYWDPLDGSLSSVSSDEDAECNNVIAAPLRRRQMRQAVQKQIQNQEDIYWKEKISSLAMQGDFTRLLIEEDTNVTWKSFLWGLPRGVAKFAINAGLNTLPSADNLKRWGKRTSDICKVCNTGKQTLHHILSSCNISLEQGRLTFRHDSCLKTIYDFIKQKLKPDNVIFCDLIGNGTGGGGTIPPHIITTSQRPDLVIINEQEKFVILFELSVPWDSNINSAHTYKQNKYSALKLDLQAAGFFTFLFCFEVSVRGQISKSNKSQLKTFLFKSTDYPRSNFKSFINNISKAALLGSFTIFNARNEPSWSTTPPLSVKI